MSYPSCHRSSSSICGSANHEQNYRAARHGTSAIDIERGLASRIFAKLNTNLSALEYEILNGPTPHS